MRVAHQLTFETPEQAEQAKETSQEVKLIPQVTVSGNILLLETPYALGFIMRSMLYTQAEPLKAWWNCHPGTLNKIPLVRRVSWWQVLITGVVCICVCGIPTLFGAHDPFDFYENMILGLLFTILSAALSADLVGLVWSQFFCRRKG
jgi:hypothetical protein